MLIKQLIWSQRIITMSMCNLITYINSFIDILKIACRRDKSNNIWEYALRNTLNESLRLKEKMCSCLSMGRRVNGLIYVVHVFCRKLTQARIYAHDIHKSVDYNEWNHSTFGRKTTRLGVVYN